LFDSLSDRLSATFRNLRGKGRLSEADVDATIREIRRALLDADVALAVVRAFTGRVRERALSEEVSKALNPGQQVVKIVNDELIGILGGQTRRIQFAKRPPTVIMLAGLQGAGKTTLAGKLAHWLKSDGHRPMLVAADLQRPNAVNQLQVVGERAGAFVYAPEPGNGVGDPVQVAKDSIEVAKSKLYDVVVVDTAGRLGIDEELMQQAADIRAAVNPDEVLFVIDAMIGQDAVATAQAFNEGVDFTGVVLSKLDGDSRGGAALSVAEVTGKPIMFASTGEGMTDFEQFHPDRMADRILDMGDILTLIEQAEKTFDEKEAEKLAKKVEKGEDFDLNDFLTQMSALKKMGSLKKMLGMMPGMNQFREQLDAFDEREIDRIEAIVRSMTPQERSNPRILNGSRRTRIAKGSGTTVTAVNQLMDRFSQAQKMMRQMGKKGGRGMPGMGGGMPGMPAMPGMPTGGGGTKKSSKKKGNKKKGGKSGNPAKRAEEARQAQLRREGKTPDPVGSAFGGIDMGGEEEFDLSKLPKGFGGFGTGKK
jgi:signal recognition particle subunit SRP54